MRTTEGEASVARLPDHALTSAGGGVAVGGARAVTVTVTSAPLGGFRVGRELGFREDAALFGASSVWLPKGVKGGGSFTVGESDAKVFPHMVDVQYLPAVKR